MLWLAEQGLPPRFDCLEIGSSAGINLMIDRYHYELGGVHVGPQPGAMAFAPEWRGNPPAVRLPHARRRGSPGLAVRPQTSGVGRWSTFIAGCLWLAEPGLPPRFDCLEIGSSAGINLMIDRYHYELGGVHVGPQPGAMAFAPEWRGNHPPMRDIEIASLKGCDVAPVDLTDPVQALRPPDHIWPEQTRRAAWRARVGQDV